MSTSSEHKTRQLLKDLDFIEKKSASLRQESERLRRMKDEAKDGLAKRYPHLFNHDQDNLSSKFFCHKQFHNFLVDNFSRKNNLKVRKNREKGLFYCFA